MPIQKGKPITADDVQQKFFQRKNSFVVIGDSIMGDMSQDQRNKNAVRLGFWLEWVSDSRFNMIFNAGIPGNNSSQLLARLHTDVIDKEPDHCLIMVGTNDDPTGVSIDTHYANIVATVNELINYNITPIVVSIPPRAAAKSWISSANGKVSQYCRDNGIIYINAFYALYDRVSGGLDAAYDSGDGTHLNQLGLYTLAKEIWATLASEFASPHIMLSSDNSDTSNLVINGTFDLDSDANGLPDNWINTASSTLTPSLIVPADDTPGKILRLSTTASVTNYVYQSIAMTGFTVGDTLKLSLKSRIESGQWSVYINPRDSGNVSVFPGYYTFRSLEQPFDGASFFVSTMEFEVPPNTATLRLLLQSTAKPGAAEFSQVTLRKVG